MADLYSIIVLMEHLEKAFIRDSITADEYTPQCANLIAKYKTTMNFLSDSVDNLEAFMNDYKVSCGKDHEAGDDSHLLIAVLSCGSQSLQDWRACNIRACYWRQHKGRCQVGQIHCRERSAFHYTDGHTAIEQIRRGRAASHSCRSDPIAKQCAWTISRF